ncbi:acyl-CoA synthetase [uncultured Jatrophihabitans sp.]|uniref:acyl-CoA synthetase n=1 Tax=uncultured Jatrophihabitans sp. TaxID=1610747 RepID=UPI0035CA42A1
MYPGTFAAKFPDKPAVIMGDGTTVTYGELEARSAQLSHYLASVGVGEGDHVALLAENHPRFFEVYWGVIRSGAYLTAVNRHLSAEEIAYLIEDSDAAVVITTAAMLDKAAAALALTSDERHCLAIDAQHDGFEDYDAALAPWPTIAPEHQPRGDVMLYSSGTTGTPKGIQRPLTGRQVDDPTGRSGVGHFLGLTESAIYLCPAPLYHGAAIQWSAAAQTIGATVVVMEKFDAQDMLRVIDRDRVTHLQVVPTMFVRLLKLTESVRRGYDLSSLQFVVHAAAPCPVYIKRQMIEWLGPIVHEYYAGTEGVGMTFISADEWMTHQGSVGRAVMGTLHICDESGTELAEGEAGIAYFEMPGSRWEYHGDAGKTRSARHPQHEGWATYGDIGYLDAEGYLYLTDRRSYTIISGGVNIYPAEIESALVEHHKVMDAAVFGLPDPEMGQFVQAVVQLDEGVDPSPDVAEELRAYLRTRLAGFKIPRALDFRSELPRQPNGKLYKQPLQEEYLAAAAR